MENIRNSESLKPSMGDDISDEILSALQDTKDILNQWKHDGYTTAIVHLSGDLTHAAHVQYINIIKAKISDRMGVPIDKVKLAVGVEADSRTKTRKAKDNVFKEQERVYVFSNLKSVDHAYIEFEGIEEQKTENRPAGIVRYLEPDIMVSHQEHFGSLSEYVGAAKRMAKDNGGKVLIVNYGDEKYLGEKNVRDTFGRSTTNTIKSIFDLYSDNPKYNVTKSTSSEISGVLDMKTDSSNI